jgi:hypothetical protein
VAITTLDGLLAALAAKPTEDVIKAAFTGKAAGQYHSAFYLAGRPGAAAAPSPGLAGAALTSYAGQIPFPAAVGGQNVYLARLEGSQGGAVGCISVWDRLWHNSGIGITTTTAQTVNSGTLPARDADGSTNGNGVMAALEFSATSTNGAVSNTTLSYTNSTGTAGKTATLPTTPAAITAGTILQFMLAAGDLGIRSIQSLTLGTTYVTGTAHLVLYRQIATLPLAVVGQSNSLDAIALGVPRMYDNSVPFLIYGLTGTAGGIVDAQLSYAQG